MHCTGCINAYVSSAPEGFYSSFPTPQRTRVGGHTTRTSSHSISNQTHLVPHSRHGFYNSLSKGNILKYTLDAESYE
jgi:hypothetical protein